MPREDYYALLGVAREATPEEIGRAFRRLAARYHPDRNPADKAAEEKFKKISEAYTVLSDPKARAAYDQGGMERVREETGFGGFETTEEVFGQFGDLFEELFGARGRRPAAPEPGLDIEAELKISFEEAARGGTKTVTLTLPTLCRLCKGSGTGSGAPVRCATCDGSGRVTSRGPQAGGFFSITSTCPECGGRRASNRCVECGGRGTTAQPRTVEVTIPPGIEDGSILRLRGLGTPGMNGGPPGNLKVRIRHDRHPIFERSGLDLRCTVPVDLATAVLGGRIDVPLLEGKAEMTVPPGTQPNQPFRLAGQGLKDPQGRRGDLIVATAVRIPKTLSERAQEVFRGLRDELRSGDNATRGAP